VSLFLQGLNTKVAGSLIELKIGDVRIPRYQGVVSTPLLLQTLSANELVSTGSALMSV
jgi:hypothetical protein